MPLFLHLLEVNLQHILRLIRSLDGVRADMRWHPDPRAARWCIDNNFEVTYARLMSNLCLIRDVIEQQEIRLRDHCGDHWPGVRFS